MTTLEILKEKYIGKYLIMMQYFDEDDNSEYWFHPDNSSNLTKSFKILDIRYDFDNPHFVLEDFFSNPHESDSKSEYYTHMGFDWETDLEIIDYKK